MLSVVVRIVMPKLVGEGAPPVHWIIDDTGSPKKASMQ